MVGRQVSSPSSELEHPTLCGRYEVLRQIGKGGLGLVYEGRHTAVGRAYAIKVLRKEYRDQPSVVSRFRREARIGGQVDSPYTVPVFDFDVFRGAPFIVMELLHGETLKESLRRPEFLSCEHGVIELTARIIEAGRGIAVAHSMGVFHRDIKPSNLFISSGEHTRRCRVLDFGVAKQSEAEAPDATDVSVTESGALLGTLAYMAPEQIRGEPIDGRADVYSLGVVLYECLTGQQPFASDARHTTMYRILEEQLPPLRRVVGRASPRLSACVARATNKHRELRYASMAEFCDALASCLDELKASATSSDWGMAKPRAKQVRVSLAWSLIALALSSGDGPAAVVPLVATADSPPVAVVDSIPMQNPVNVPNPRASELVPLDGARSTVEASTLERMLTDGPKGVPSQAGHSRERPSPEQSHSPASTAAAAGGASALAYPFDRVNPYQESVR